MSLNGVTATAGPKSSSPEIRMSGFTSATIVGSYVAPCRRPPVTSRAPLATASFTHSSTRIASCSRIIGPTWTAGSSWLPTFSAATFGRRASRKSPYTFPAVSTRWVEMHTCPALAYPVAATSAATLSRSASGITTTGEFEPSSIVTRLMPAVLQMRSPTSRLPVKVIFLTRRSATSRSPISPPEPVSVLSPSGGSPASSRISVSRSADSGVSVAGLSTTAFPPARAGPTLWQTRLSGKLNGLIATTTPHGTRIVTPNLPRPCAAPSRATVSPCTRLASSADSIIVSTARRASARPSARIFPSSFEISVPSSSTLRRLERALDVGRVRARHGVDQAVVVRVAHLDRLGLVEPLTRHVHLHDNPPDYLQGAGTRAIATPAPRRNLTLTHAYTLPLRARTRHRHARPPPQSHADSRLHATPARAHPTSPRPHPAAISR